MSASVAKERLDQDLSARFLSLSLSVCVCVYMCLSLEALASIVTSTRVSSRTIVSIVQFYCQLRQRCTGLDLLRLLRSALVRKDLASSPPRPPGPPHPLPSSPQAPPRYTPTHPAKNKKSKSISTRFISPTHMLIFTFSPRHQQSTISPFGSLICLVT